MDCDCGRLSCHWRLDCDYGRLSRNWRLLPAANFSESGPGVPPRLNLGAPSLHFDADEGFYYTIGGGSITAGPVRSKTLRAGDWEISPRAPMAAPAAATALVGLPTVEVKAYRGVYKEVWALATAADRQYVEQYLANSSDWNFGSTDPDFCCSDGNAPSYLLRTLSQQGGHPKTGRPGGFAALDRFNGTLEQWLRSYF